MTLAIGVDVGGTKVAAGVVDEHGRIIAKLKRSTPAASPPRTEQAIAGAVTELLGQYDVAAIGLGAAGFVDNARASLLFAPNLAWRDEPLKQRVEERLGREVVVENDANASAWAEARFGAARGYRDVMLVAALRCFQTVGGWLGQGLADLAAILDPACFVIGGGLSGAGVLLLDPARTAFERALTGRGYRPLAEIKVAELGEDAGIVGAADLARAASQAPAPPATAGPVQAPRTRAGRTRAPRTTAARDVAVRGGAA